MNSMIFIPSALNVDATDEADVFRRFHCFLRTDCVLSILIKLDHQIGHNIYCNFYFTIIDCLTLKHQTRITGRITGINYCRLFKVRGGSRGRQRTILPNVPKKTHEIENFLG